MNIFFTADTSFSLLDKGIQYGRQFDDEKVMNSYIIDRWNSVVSGNDIVYSLGNFGDYYVLNKLNGRIIILEGTRECADFDGLTCAEKTEFFANNYGIPYNPPTPNISIQVSDSDTRSIALSLHPGIPTDICDVEHTGVCTLYSDPLSKDIMTEYGINVAIDLHNFKPITLDTISFYVKGLLTGQVVQYKH